jgi:hypothetical protein
MRLSAFALTTHKAFNFFIILLLSKNFLLSHYVESFSRAAHRFTIEPVSEVTEVEGRDLRQDVVLNRVITEQPIYRPVPFLGFQVHKNRPMPAIDSLKGYVNLLHFSLPPIGILFKFSSNTFKIEFFVSNSIWIFFPFSNISTAFFISAVNASFLVKSN